MIKNQFCEVCERPAVKEHSLFDDEGTNSYYCSSDCKQFAHWRGKVIMGIVILVIGLFVLRLAWPISLILWAAGGVAIWFGNQHSKITLRTGIYSQSTQEESENK